MNLIVDNSRTWLSRHRRNHIGWRYIMTMKPNVNPFYFKDYERTIGVARNVSELSGEIARLAEENPDCCDVSPEGRAHCAVVGVHEREGVAKH